MLIPGSPVTSTGRPAPRSRGSRVRVCTTGPVQASSRTSGRRRATRASSPGRLSTVTPSGLAAAIWLAEGITALRSSTCSLLQPAGSPASVAALHLR